MIISIYLDTETAFALFQAACDANTTPCRVAEKILREALRKEKENVRESEEERRI